MNQNLLGEFRVGLDDELVVWLLLILFLYFSIDLHKKAAQKDGKEGEKSLKYHLLL